MANELWWLILLVVNFSAILFIYRFFGRIGILAWIPISTILANIQVLKTIEIFGITATLGNIVYATSFLVTDILSENYGKKSARSAVLIGFFSLISATVIMNLALGFHPAPEDFAHESMVTLFSILPRVSLASLVAYGLSQLHDIWSYQYWRKRFPSTKFIWLRNNASTMVSQLIDTLIFNTIAFAWVFPWNVWWEINLTTYLLKWLVAALDTPLVYISARWFTKGTVRELENQLD